MGRGLAHMTHFYMHNCGLRKICHGTPLTEINDAVDDGPVDDGVCRTLDCRR